MRMIGLKLYQISKAHGISQYSMFVVQRFDNFITKAAPVKKQLICKTYDGGHILTPNTYNNVQKID